MGKSFRAFGYSPGLFRRKHDSLILLETFWKQYVFSQKRRLFASLTLSVNGKLHNYRSNTELYFMILSVCVQ